MGMIVQLGLPEGLRGQAAALYWQAFGAKLGRVMGPDARALRYLERVIRTDHVIVALEGGQLLGLVGFKTPQAAFAGGGLGDMWAIYGPGALWRAGLLQLLARDVDNARFLMDGLCVDAAARGRGVGTALLDAIADEARVRGYGAVRLDVIDSNARARALYERQGFVAVRTAGLGVLRHVFGFASATTMVRGV
jgi:ribosomal protein S18 acetylase RimI-like enzyme